jgi:hypothetical protein
MINKALSDLYDELAERAITKIVDEGGQETLEREFSVGIYFNERGFIVGAVNRSLNDTPDSVPIPGGDDLVAWTHNHYNGITFPSNADAKLTQRGIPTYIWGNTNPNAGVAVPSDLVIQGPFVRHTGNLFRVNPIPARPGRYGNIRSTQIGFLKYRFGLGL